MSKIGIATITIMVNNENAYNYGNKLQMYALQEYLRSQGHECETIKYQFSPPIFHSEVIRQKYVKSFRQIMDDVYRIGTRKLLRNKLKIKARERKDKFDAFVKEHIAMTSECFSVNSDFTELGRKYDFYITGSDQVWNPYCEGSNEFYYLTFAPKEKRIAYAPSIAVDHIPNEMMEKYYNWISNISYLSIREDTGKKLLSEQFEFNAKLVCDPVFLLGKEQWALIAKKTAIRGKYFVTYFLGKKTVETKKKIKQFEKKSGLKCVDVYTRDNISSTFAGPEEFLGLIMNAKFICTDSFHGAAFATIFEVPMVIFNRESGHKMNSRIDSLLRVADIERRNVDEVLLDIDSLFDVAFDEKGNLGVLIQESKAFLNAALKDGG